MHMERISIILNETDLLDFMLKDEGSDHVTAKSGFGLNGRLETDLNTEAALWIVKNTTDR